jgi:hypothetical protein
VILGLEDSSVKWRDVLRRASLLLGLISLVLAIWTGTHFQHLLDNGGSRHAGETLVAVLLKLLVFAGSWYGVRSTPGT